MSVTESQGWPGLSPLDTARRQRSIEVMKARSIPYFATLPMIRSEEAILRSPDEIGRRLLAMFAVSVCCEVVSSGETWDDTTQYLEKINDVLGGSLAAALTPEETTFLAARPTGQRELAKFGWRYECCHVLMWALGFSELGYPSKICDVAAMGNLIWNQRRLATMLGGASPVSKDVALDAADLVLMYNWACVDARIHGRPAPGQLNGEVVVEWHHAVNWLVGAYENAGWDDVGTDT